MKIANIIDLLIAKAKTFNYTRERICQIYVKNKRFQSI